MERRKKESRLDQRLDYLATLEPGWHDGEGEPIAHLAIDSARRLLTQIDGEQYTAFAMLDGGISLEPRDPEAINTPYYEVSPDGGIQTTHT
jgi:hypothetical protein